MQEQKHLYAKPEVVTHFVGRRKALEMFYQRFAYRHMKNGIYYYASGGIGKSWILQRILVENEHDATRTVTNVIDFSNTTNHSLHGLQNAIRSRLESSELPDAFRQYDDAVHNLEVERKEQSADKAATIASLQERINKAFIKSCQTASAGRDIILLFDTFERVQQRHVGEWLVNVFLPQVKDLIIAIAGRPSNGLANVPDNILPYQLSGLEESDVSDYVAKIWPRPIPPKILQQLCRNTGGNPLLIQLALDAFITDLARLEQVASTEDLRTLRNLLARNFSPPTNVNRIIWSMAFLKRRFDLHILEHIIEFGHSLSLEPQDAKMIAASVLSQRFVKVDSEIESHLLHDEMQVIVANLLDDVDPRRQFRDELYRIIVQEYYSDLIDGANKEGKRAFAQSLQAEQLGYMMSYQTREGLKQYGSFREDIEASHDYDFEELLWGEVRDNIDFLDRDGYDVCFERGQWLIRHRLYSKAVDHFRDMSRRFSERLIAIHRWLGFALLRCGDFDGAVLTLEAGLSQIPKDDYRNIAEYQNTLGQVNRAKGAWDTALDNYGDALIGFASARDQSGMAGVYLNRGFLYSLTGNYDFAIEQC